MKLYRINALLLKYFYITINRADRLFDIFYWPLLDLVVWGFASYFIDDLSNVNVLSMFLGGVILWIFVWRASQDIAIFMLEDFWSKSLYHLFSSPVKISEHIASIIIVGFLRSSVTFLVMGVLAFLMYSFNIFSLSILFVAAAIGILTLFGWAIGLFVTSLILRFGQRIQVLAWSVAWIVQPFSCIFYPLSALPSWAQNIAMILPTTPVFENLRSLLFEGVVSYSQLGTAFLINVVLILAAGWFLKTSFDHARKSGLLAKGD